MEAEPDPPIVEEQPPATETIKTEVEEKSAPKKETISEVKPQVEKEITVTEVDVIKVNEEAHVNISTQPDATSIDRKSIKSQISEAETQSIGSKSRTSQKSNKSEKGTKRGKSIIRPTVIEIDPEKQDGSDYVSYDVGKISEEGDEEEGRVTITFESIAELTRQKKKQRREEMRLLRLQGLEGSMNELMEADQEKAAKPKKEKKTKSIILNRSFVSSIHRSMMQLNEEEEEEDYQDYATTFQMILDRTYDEQLLQELADKTTSSESESESTVGSEKNAKCSVDIKNRFLDYFDELPSVTDISSCSDEEKEKAKIEEEIEEEHAEMGKFVNPLTGETESESSDSASAISITLASIVEEPAVVEVEEQEEVEQDIGIELQVEYSDWNIHPEEVNETDGAVAMLLNFDSNLFDLEVVSQTDIARERLNRAIRKVVIDLLFRLFDEVVDSVEYIDPKVVLSRNLDKLILLDELRAATDAHIEIKFMNTNLNNKVVDFYKRQKAFRSITPTEPNVDIIEYFRYIEILNRYDYFKAMCKAASKQNSDLMSSVMMDLQYHFILSQTTAIDFANKVRETLIRKDSEFLKRVVERDMIAMNHLRDEISDLKMFIIVRQHTLARLDERIQKFEDITDDLTLNNFLRMQREVQLKGKTLEERSSDLHKMHVRFDKEIHMLAHIREKTEMLRLQLEADRANLKEKVAIKDELRIRLLQVKEEHASLYIKTQDTYFKGGLLFKPALMLDYDVTMKLVINKRASVKKLKETMAQLEQRIHDAEKGHTKEIIDLKPSPSKAGLAKPKKKKKKTPKTTNFNLTGTQIKF